MYFYSQLAICPHHNQKVYEQVNDLSSKNLSCDIRYASIKPEAPAPSIM